MPYKPWMLAAMDQAGYNGIHDKHIEAVAAELLCTRLTEVDREAFRAACRRCGVDPNHFTTEDLDELECVLNR